ncbi:TIGR03943 family protein [Synechococcales cyanobacterium C]|uniref:TIGR03943 family protein n=1 Tax=Petrachloros mirabilis ULC683 TaxID=2781853 RepID=A0A8K2AC74_9CYAN|nr:TIGR03943 family protein [Petrachloros mirabilis]NCJ05789.1 TIGR03943 family protein [Petrachloros mirabilis ULC683]
MTLAKRLSQVSPLLPDWMDTLALGAWGVLMMKYWLTGRLGLLIHPNYFGLTIGAGLLLLVMTGLNLQKLLRGKPQIGVRHFTLFPPGWMSMVLLVSALLGLWITPRPFASETALERGLQDSALLTRAQPQTFRPNADPAARSLIDWVRTLDVYPEPDAYSGQPVQVQGFAVHTPNLPDAYLMLTRFVITCCAADAYPVGLPVKLPQSRQAYPPDQWFDVSGQMVTETLDDRRQLVIAAETLQGIPAPRNPYAY